MSIQQQLSRCLELIEAMQQQLRAGKWQKLALLEGEYARLFEQLKGDVAVADRFDHVTVAAMQRLEQQQRRLQRQLSVQMRDAAEKIAVVDDARKRLQTSQRIASSAS